jgi:GTPase SAR1 family protein
MSDSNAANCYDIICNIDSILNLPNGWEFSYTDKGSKRYEESKNKASCTVAVVGNANKGKSYILQKLAGDKFPSGFAVKTEGLSLKYPKSENLNFILLDTAGLETPLIKEPYYNLDEDFEKEKAKSENQKSDGNGETNKEETTKDEYIKEQLIVKYARDKTITEFFLQSFVTSRSDVLILVMNLMTYSDQILLNKVKRDVEKEENYLSSIIYRISIKLNMLKITFKTLS